MSSVSESLMNLDTGKLIEKFNKLPEDVRNAEIKSNRSIYIDKSQMVDLLTRQQKVENINRGTFRHTVGKHLSNAHTKQAFNGNDIIVTLNLESDKEKYIKGVGKYPLTTDPAKEDVNGIINKSFQYFKKYKGKIKKGDFL